MKNEKIIYKNPNRSVYLENTEKGKAGPLASEHFHSEIEFILVTSGKIKIALNNIDLVADEGEIVFVNSRVVHSSAFLEDGSSLVLVQFRNPSSLKSNLKYLSEFLKQDCRQGFVFKKDDPDHIELSNYITNISDNHHQKGIAHDYYTTANIFSILALLHKRQFLAVPESYIEFDLLNKILPVIEIIDSSYNETLNLENLSKILHLNKDYFCRLFKKTTGASVVEYINFVRICKAEELLKSNMNITDIAHATGFSSLSYFNRIFNKYKGYSPTYFRKFYSSNQ